MQDKDVHALQLQLVQSNLAELERRGEQLRLTLEVLEHNVAFLRARLDALKGAA